MDSKIVVDGGSARRVELTEAEQARRKQDARNYAKRMKARKRFLVASVVIDRLSDDELDVFTALVNGTPAERRFLAKFNAAGTIEATDPAVVSTFEGLFPGRSKDILAPE